MFDKIWLYLGIALAAIGAYFGWKTKVRSDARNEERQRQQQEVVNAAKDRKNIEHRVDSATDEQLDKWLQPPKR